MTTIPQGLQQLQTNNQYVGELVKYFGTQISSMKPGDTEQVLAKTKKYVEDTCSQIADNILNIGDELTNFLTIQANQLDSLTRRVNSITLRFEAHDAVQLAYMHVHEPVPSMLRHFHSLPASADQVVQRMLAKNPEERFPSTVESIEELRKALGEVGTDPDAGTLEVPVLPQS